jgi:hypothetical protein
VNTKLIAVAAAGLALTVTASAGASIQPSVRFAGLIPVKVQGSHFVSSEHVLVTVRAGKTALARTVLASKTGAFLINFGVIPTRDRCSGSVSITATGRRGDHAAYKLPQMACPMATTTPSNA